MTGPRSFPASQPAVTVLVALMIALVVLVVSGGAYAVFRRLRPDAAVSQRPPDEAPGCQVSNAPLAYAERTVAHPLRSLPALPSEEAVGASPEAVANESVVVKKRNLLFLAHTRRLIEEADEPVFDALRLSEAIRTSIRSINQIQGDRRQAFLSDESANRAPEEMVARARAARTEADGARGVAVTVLLGRDTAKAFFSAEAENLRGLRRRFHGYWPEDAELDELSPGGPPALSP